MYIKYVKKEKHNPLPLYSRLEEAAWLRMLRLHAYKTGAMPLLGRSFSYNTYSGYKKKAKL